MARSACDQSRPKETSMTIRSLAASASVIALCLVGAALSGISGEAARGQSAPSAVAAAQGTAPNFAGISNWFNSAPLNMTDLRGKVVLVDFWTYGCVNCVNTLPHVTELYAKYRDRGLVVVGIQRAGRAETARHHLSGRTGQRFPDLERLS